MLVRAATFEVRQKAARELFTDRGYSGTTINEIAATAGVAVETIYRVFGSKASLFKGVLEAAIAGGAERAAIPPEQRPAVRKMAQELDPRRVLALHAATQPGIHARSGAYYRALREAASVDPDLADVWRQLEAQRLAGMRRLAQRLYGLGALRPGLSVEDARDILWTVNSHAVYDLLVVQAAGAIPRLDRGHQRSRSAWAGMRRSAWLLEPSTVTHTCRAVA